MFHLKTWRRISKRENFSNIQVFLNHVVMVTILALNKGKHMPVQGVRVGFAWFLNVLFMKNHRLLSFKMRFPLSYLRIWKCACAVSYVIHTVTSLYDNWVAKVNCSTVAPPLGRGHCVNLFVLPMNHFFTWNFPSRVWSCSQTCEL